MELHDDDQPVGRVLSRREVLALLGKASAAAIAGTGFAKFGFNQVATPTPTPLPACVVRPELTEGPYFVDDQLNRSDIRIEPSDESIKEGTLLHILFRVSDATTGSCVPLAGAQVDIWHCDADGAYSGVSDPGFDTSDQMWLRGYQIADADGHAEFTTIYPGWYSSRAVHIHFKIRTDPDSDTGYEFTSQFFFDEELTDKVHAEAPYAAKGYRDTLNADDNIYQGTNGVMTLELTEYETETEKGYTATFDIALDTSQVSSSGGGGAPPSGGRPGRPTSTPTPGS
ncbi:MAG: intradiol ring-cleavage dioxygenase [Anaerolineae bacterium]|nr:intradiol ring-cleavage dioxygenase [Anaerolineae bacterium]